MEVLCIKGHWHSDMESANLCGPSVLISKDNMPKDIQVPVAAEQNVIITKEYGPLMACDVRVRLDFQKAEWVIERKCYKEDITSWQEMARFDCQESIEPAP